MSANKFTDAFKRDAVAQVEDRGYPVREVAQRLWGQHQVDLHMAEAVFATGEGDQRG